MAWLCALIAWFAASLWVGALGLENILAVGRRSRLELLKAGSEFARLAELAQRRLRRLELAATLLLSASTVAATIRLEQATWFDALSLGCAALATIMLVFHRQQRRADSYEGSQPSAIWQGSNAGLAILALCATGWTLSGAALARRSWINWAFIVGSGALIGTVILSGVLLFALNRLTAQQREMSLAVVAVRWTAHIACLILVLALPMLSIMPLLWHFSTALAAIAIAALAVSCCLLMIVRFRLVRDLWKRLLALPVVGIPSRSLRSRAIGWQRGARAVMWGSAICGVMLLALASPVAALAAWPSYRAGPWQYTLGIIPAKNVPTATPTLAAFDAAQTTVTHGVHFALTVPHAHSGPNAIHLSIADNQGQAISNLHVTLIANMALVNVGTAAVTASPDPDQRPTDFAAMLTLPRPGSWQIVVFVSTADQSLSATAIFTLPVPA